MHLNTPGVAQNLICYILCVLTKLLSGVNFVGVNHIFHGTHMKSLLD
jgi:hypothetical protein